MFRILSGATLACSLLTATSLAAQQPGSAASDRRMQVIVASFNKSKHVVKERHGVRKEKFKDIRSEPVVKANPADYSGTYEVNDLGLAVTLHVDRNGNVEGTGYEPAGGETGVRRTFALRGRVEGALLTATQTYADGTTDRFEGVFINRTDRDSPTDKGVTVYGLGVIGRYIQFSGFTTNRFFYELKP